MTMQDRVLGRARRWRGSAALVGLSLALLGIIAIEASDWRVIEATPEAGDAAAPPPEATPKDDRLGFALPPLSDHAEALRRPLFTETRRPPLQVIAAEVAPLSLTLVAIVIAQGERHALVEFGNPPHRDRIGEGQEIDGWTVDSIQLDRILLSRGDRRVEVKVKDDVLPVAPAEPPGSKVPVETTPATPFLPGAAPSKVFPGG